jgi:hypothetical protein
LGEDWNICLLRENLKSQFSNFTTNEMVVDDGMRSSKADVQDVNHTDESKTHVLLNQSINCETDV